MNAKQNHCRPAGRAFTCQPESPNPEVIAAAAAAILAGEVVCFPTTGLYGLGADAFNIGAIKRVFEIKRRPPDRPVLVLVDSVDQLKELVVRVPVSGHDLIKRFWPGKLTLVFQARRAVPDLLTAGTGKIGIRVPGHTVARALLAELDCPITGTSANISGEPGCHRISDLPESVCRAVCMVLDGGDLEGGVGSTVVDVSGEQPIVLREGAVPADLIRHH